jgi:hypothetical protein
MFYKFSVAVVVLALGAGGLLADDKEKKDAKKEADKKGAISIKGSVLKFDQAKHALTLKAADGEKEYSLGEEVVIVFATGQKVTSSQKKGAVSGPADKSKQQADQALLFVLRTGNQVELVLAEKENTIKEIHWDSKKPIRISQRKAPNPPGGTKKEAPNKDDGKN